MSRANGELEYRTNEIKGTKTNHTNMDVPGHEDAAYSKAIGIISEALERGFGTRCRARALAGLDLDAAQKDCDTALQIDDKNGSGHHYRGIVAFRRGDWSAALADFNASLAIDAKAVEPLYMKGIVERRQGNATAGDADIASAKSVNPHVGDFYAQYGILP